MILTSASLSVQYDNIFSPFPGHDWARGLQWIKDSGFDAVELILTDPDLLDISAIEKKLTHLDLPVSTISTGQAAGMEGLSLMAASNEVRRATMDRLRRDVDFAAALDRPNVTVGLIRGRGGLLPFDVEHQLLCRGLKEIAEYAAQKDIVLNLEPINRYECVHINAASEAAAILDEIGNPPNVGILYDTFHSNIEDQDMLETIRQLTGKISNVHIADSNRQLPGEGHIDFISIIHTLQETGYDGYVALETLMRPNAQHIIKNAEARIRNIFN